MHELLTYAAMPNAGKVQNRLPQQPQKATKTLKTAASMRGLLSGLSAGDERITLLVRGCCWTTITLLVAP